MHGEIYVNFNRWYKKLKGNSKKINQTQKLRMKAELMLKSVTSKNLSVAKTFLKKKNSFLLVSLLLIKIILPL